MDLSFMGLTSLLWSRSLARYRPRIVPSNASRATGAPRGRHSDDNPRVPLFMDRHDIPGVTAEQVARLHVLDLPVAARRGVEFLTYWFDADAGAAFCLARAGKPDELTAVHRESHGQVPNRIIEVSESNVLKLLGKIEDPGDRPPTESPFRTIMFTDLEGSTALLSAIGQSAYLALLAEHDMIIRRAIVAGHGREVKHTGDGFMASFDDDAKALACAREALDTFDAKNTAGAGPALLVRIGLAAGEPVDRDDDLFGSTVNLASRICSAANGGQILVSELVRDLGMKAGFSFTAAGSRTLKGFPGTTPLFELNRTALRTDS
jgi:class 3 adenylate cyclase